MKTQRRDSTRLAAEDLSTSPGANAPIVPVEAGADILTLPENRPTSSIKLRPTWSPYPITVPLPLRLWNSRCLILNGFADADVLDAETNFRPAQRVNDKFEPADSSRAWVQLYGSDYGGTTLGPFKAVFTLIYVKPVDVKPVDVEVPRFMWWQYWGNSLVNKEFKEKVWGIKPNNLAVIETAYLGKRKAVRLLQEGRTAFQMVWNSARFPHLVEVPQHLALKTVAPARKHDNGENDVVMDAISLKRGDAEGPPMFPFDSRDDDFYFDSTTEIGKYLKRIDFTPVTWQCMLNYGGVVKIYDEHGGGARPGTRSTGAARKPARRAGH